MNGSKDLYFDPGARFGCIQCGKCCGAWPIAVSTEEQSILSGLSIPGLPEQGSACFKHGFLAKKKNRCVYLSDRNQCLIHQYHSESVKALACRLYPFDIRTWEDGSVSAILRYDCPAVALGRGSEKTSNHRTMLLSLATELESSRSPASACYRGNLMPGIPRLREIAEAYRKILLDSSVSPALRIYSAVCLLIFHADEKNQSDIIDAEDFQRDSYDFFRRSLDHLSETLAGYRTISPDRLFAFRMLLLIFLRDDTGKNFFKRLSSTLQSVRFSAGRGSFASIGAGKSRVPSNMFFKVAASCKTEKNAFRPYWNFLNGRLQAFYFCGTPCADLSFEDGMAALLVLYPILRVMTGAEAAVRGDFLITEHDVAAALMNIDHGFLRHGLFRKKSFRGNLRNVVLNYEFAYFLSATEKDSKH